MGMIKVATSFNIDLEFEIPEFHRRLFAWMIDVLLQYIYIRIASDIFFKATYSDIYTEDGQYNMWDLQWMLFLPPLLYHPVCEMLMNGQSLGKKVIGLRVVSEIS